MLGSSYPPYRSSKLVMRVRFPSLALIVLAQVSGNNRTSVAAFVGSRIAFRAISGPLAHRDEHARCAIVIVPPPAFGFDMSVDAVSDDLVGTAHPVLVDQRCALAVMPHACHEILDPRTASSAKGITGPQADHVLTRVLQRADHADLDRPAL
jgi:hypothetical protein